MRTIAALCLSVSTGVSCAQLLNFTAAIDGSVNGSGVSATGSGMVDIDQAARSEGTLTFSDIPENFDPLAPSLLSNLCANAFQDQGGTQNLWALGGGNYDVSRTFQWLGDSQSQLFMDSQVSRVGDDIVSDSTLTGTYAGPTDIVGVRSYAITWVPSSAPGEVFEAGTMVLERAGGSELILQFTSVYSGLAGSLQQTQFGSGEFDVTFDGTTLSVGWDGQFRVPTPAAALPLGVGLIALRRRRS